VHVEGPGQRQAAQGVDAGRLEQFLAKRAAQLVHVPVHVPTCALEEHLPGQRVAVGVQAAAGEREHGVPGLDPLRPEQVVCLDHACRRAREVVLVGIEQAGVLGRLAADQRSAGEPAPLGHPGHDGGDALGHDPAAGDVVGDEQRLGTADDEVVHEHADQVLADGVVPVHPLGDGDLGAHPIGGRRQQRSAVAPQGRGVEQPGEAAETADDLGPAGPGDACPHELDRSVTGVDVDARGGVGDRLATGSRRGGHGSRLTGAHRRADQGRVSASAPPTPPSSA